MLQFVVLSTYLLHLLQSFLILCWDEAPLLSLEAIAAAQWRSKYLWILCLNWHGHLFLFGCKDSALKSDCASLVGTCKHKRNAFVWGTEWSLNFLSVFGLVTAIQTIATYSKVALHFFQYILDWCYMQFHFMSSSAP